MVQVCEFQLSFCVHLILNARYCPPHGVMEMSKTWSLVLNSQSSERGIESLNEILFRFSIQKAGYGGFASPQSICLSPNPWYL